MSHQLIGKAALALLVGFMTLAPVARAQSGAAAQIGYAASEGDVRTVVRVLDAGFDVNSRWGMFDQFALLKAAEWGHVEVVRVLLARGANPNLADSNGRTAQWWAKNNGHLQVAALLNQAENGGGKADGGAASAIPKPAEPVKPPAPKPAGPVIMRPEPGQASSWPGPQTLRSGERVIFSSNGGEDWRGGIIEKAGEPGSEFEGLYLVHDPRIDERRWSEPSAVVAAERAAFWTQYFVGDWDVNAGMAVTYETDGRDLYQVTTGGMRLPPLRINADGSYLWRVEDRGKSRVIRGRWTERDGMPGIIIKNGARGEDWVIWNRSTRSTARNIGAEAIRIEGASRSWVAHRIKKQGGK